MQTKRLSYRTNTRTHTIRHQPGVLRTPARAIQNALAAGVAVLLLGCAAANASLGQAASISALRGLTGMVDGDLALVAAYYPLSVPSPSACGSDCGCGTTPRPAPDVAT